MKVYVYPADKWGCGFYRAIWPGRAAANAGVDVTIIDPGDPEGLTAYMDKTGEKCVDVAVPPDADVVMLQRPTFPPQSAAIPVIRAKGVAVVVDVDDDLSCINPANPAWRALHPKSHHVLIGNMDGQRREGTFIADDEIEHHLQQIRAETSDRTWRVLAKKHSKHSWLAVDTACKAATLVVVSTPSLTAKYGGPRARVVRNYVPESFLSIPRVDTDVIGWAGATHSHPGDLSAMALPRPCRFMVVGDGTGAERDLGLPSIDMTGPIPFEQWASAVAQIGIGVAPLRDTKFNAAKSWLKPLEYAATGVPWVASPRAEYKVLADMGAGGVLAERTKDWQKALRRLVDNEQARRDASEAAREVAATLTIERNVHRLVDVWAEAVTLERSRVAQTVAGGR